MSRILAGGLAAILALVGGMSLILAQRQDDPIEALPPPDPAVHADGSLPIADPADMIGPAPPETTPLSREERRFARYDRNADRLITRTEMLASRTKAFRKLDVDGNNLLTFEEWAVATSERFAGADSDGNGRLTPREFATTRPKAVKPSCACD